MKKIILTTAIIAVFASNCNAFSKEELANISEEWKKLNLYQSTAIEIICFQEKTAEDYVRCQREKTLMSYNAYKNRGK